MMRKRKAKENSIIDPFTATGLLENMTLLGMVAIIGLMVLPHVNPPPRNLADDQTPTEPTPIYWQLKWADKLPHDVDTYIRCYTTVNGNQIEIITVWYAQRNSGWLGLGYDSRGYPSAETNVEQVQANSSVSRVPPNTRCRVNVHLFDRHGGNLPIYGNFLAVTDRGSPQQLTVANIPFIIDKIGLECSLAEMRWDAAGQLIPSSVRLHPNLETVRIATKGRKQDTAPTCTGEAADE